MCSLSGNLVSWSSKKQAAVARSSIKSEYRALALSVSKVIWLKQLLPELDVALPLKSVIWCNNLIVRALATNPIFHARTKHIEIDVYFIQDHVLRGALVIRYIPR